MKMLQLWVKWLHNTTLFDKLNLLTSLGISSAMISNQFLKQISWGCKNLKDFSATAAIEDQLSIFLKAIQAFQFSA